MLYLNKFIIYLKFENMTNIFFPENVFRGIIVKEIREKYPDVYSKLFGIKESSILLKKYKTPPGFLMLYFDSKKQGKYEAGDIIELELTLLGESTTFFDLIYGILLSNGEKGIGKNKYKYRIVGAEYLNRDNKFVKYVFKEAIESIRYNDIFEREKIKNDKISIIFKTPVSIKVNGEITDNFTFTEFIKRVCERFTSIAYAWCNYPEIINYSEFIEESKNIQIISKNLKIISKERISSSTKKRYKMVGYVGEITLKGENLNRYIELLTFTELIGIGKYTEWGYGKIIIKE